MSKDAAKIGVAVAIIAVATVVYFRWGRSAGAIADDTTTYWWCTKTNKAFTLSGKENEDKVATGHVTPEGSEGTPVVRRITDYVTMAKSPYTNDWTGVPAAKCEKCGEVFPLDTTGKKKNVCPKCGWDPASIPDTPGGADSSKSGD